MRKFGFITAFAENAADGVSVAGKAAAGAAASGAADSGAAASGAGGVIGMIGTMLPMILLVVVLYFIMIRPQRKKEKELKAQIDAMRVGDKVVTIGGICGKVTKIKDDYIYLETGNVGTPEDRSVLKFERSAIKAVETIHDA